MKVTRKGYPTVQEVPVVGQNAPAQQRTLTLPPWASMFFFIALPLFLGTIVELVAGSASLELPARLQLPPLAPSVMVLKGCWMGFYILSGVAGSLVAKSGSAPVRKRRAAIAWGVQLAAGAAWTFVFFLAEAFGVAVGISLLFMTAIAVAMDLFTRCSSPAGKLLTPCLLWASYLSYFTISTALLN